MGFKILLTENVSPVGAALFKSLENYPHPVVCPDFTLDDWSDERRVHELLNSTAPALVINPMHWFQAEALSASNASAILASECCTRDLTIIHISSASVFCSFNQSQGAALETSIPEPDTVSGIALLQVERAFAKANRAIILRLPWLLDSELGIIEEMCSALSSEQAVVTSEQWRVAPIYVEDVVRAVVAMAQQIFCGANNWGVYHLSSSDVCSEAEFADCIARNLTKLHVNIAPIAVSTADKHFYSGNGWLQGARCTNDFGVQRRSWRKGIKSKVQGWVDRQIAAGKLPAAELG